MFDIILPEPFKFEERSIRPPRNMFNSLLSFGNSLVYSTVLSEIYATHLDPTISFLHELYDRRFSLSLDISEVFKSLLSDRTILHLLMKKELTEGDFNQELGGILLNDSGKTKFLKHYEQKLMTTIKHRSLRKNVSYRNLLRLECYKLIKHLLDMEEYKPFVMWW
jgi:CRISP-associated protein Cas1